MAEKKGSGGPILSGLLLLGITGGAWLLSCDRGEAPKSGSVLQQPSQDQLDTQTLERLVGLWITSEKRWTGDVATYLFIDRQGRFLSGLDRQASSWLNGQVADAFGETTGELVISGTCRVQHGRLVMTITQCNVPRAKIGPGDMREIPILSLSEAELQLGGDDFGGVYNRRR